MKLTLNIGETTVTLGSSIPYNAIAEGVVAQANAAADRAEAAAAGNMFSQHDGRILGSGGATGQVVTPTPGISYFIADSDVQQVNLADGTGNGDMVIISIWGGSLTITSPQVFNWDIAYGYDFILEPVSEKATAVFVWRADGGWWDVINTYGMTVGGTGTGLTPEQEVLLNSLAYTTGAVEQDFNDETGEVVEDFGGADQPDENYMVLIPFVKDTAARVDVLEEAAALIPIQSNSISALQNSVAGKAPVAGVATPFTVGEPVLANQAVNLGSLYPKTLEAMALIDATRKIGLAMDFETNVFTKYVCQGHGNGYTGNKDIQIVGFVKTNSHVSQCPDGFLVLAYEGTSSLWHLKFSNQGEYWYQTLGTGSSIPLATTIANPVIFREFLMFNFDHNHNGVHYFRNMLNASEGTVMAGSALWDLFPDYSFGYTRTPVCSEDNFFVIRGNILYVGGIEAGEPKILKNIRHPEYLGGLGFSKMVAYCQVDNTVYLIDSYGTSVLVYDVLSDTLSQAVYVKDLPGMAAVWNADNNGKILDIYFCNTLNKLIMIFRATTVPWYETEKFKNYFLIFDPDFSNLVACPEKEFVYNLNFNSAKEEGSWDAYTEFNFYEVGGLYIIHPLSSSDSFYLSSDLITWHYFWHNNTSGIVTQKSTSQIPSIVYDKADNKLVFSQYNSENSYPRLNITSRVLGDKYEITTAP